MCICAFYFSILFHFNLSHETGYSSLGYTVGLGWLSILTAMCLVTQSCLTFSNPMDCSPPGSSVHGISQARIQEWVDFSSSRRFSQPRDRTQVSRIAGRFSTSWAAREAQDYWSEEPILPDPGIDPGSPALQVDSLPTKLSEKPSKCNSLSLLVLIPS